MEAKNIISTARAFCTARMIQPSTLGMYAVKDAHALERLERGVMSYRRAERLLEYIRRNWPPDKPIPADLEDKKREEKQVHND